MFRVCSGDNRTVISLQYDGYGRANTMLRVTCEVQEIDFWWTYLLKLEVCSGGEEISVIYDGSRKSQHDVKGHQRSP